MIEYAEHVDRSSEVFIYWLTNPITSRVFYVGMTKNPEQRYKYHSRAYDDSSKNPALRAVMNQIIASGKMPEMRVIDSCCIADWKRLERYWICKCALDWQLPLCNISLGGNQVEMTPAVRAKISKSRLGKNLPESTKAKMKGREAWNKGMVGVGENVSEILQVDKNGKVVAAFPSIRQACLTLGFNRGAMSLVVNGKRGKKTLGGCIFKKANERP